MQSEQHRARERALRCGHRAEQSKCQPPRPAHEWNVVAEDSDQAVRERDARDAVGAADARISVEQRTIADCVARRIEDDLRKLPGVAKPYVETLAGDGMKRLRRVAEHDAAHARGL